MKSTLLFLFYILLFTSSLTAQNKEVSKKTGWCNDIDLNLSLPIDGFASTHSFGIGAQYSWSKHRFGKMSSTPAKKIDLTANAGVDYYFGKKETIGTVPNTTTYKNQGYTYAHLYGGFIYNPCSKGNISLTAGPALGFVGGHSNFNLGVSLSGSLYISPSGQFGITPNFTLMKQKESDALYTFGVRGSYAF